MIVKRAGGSLGAWVKGVSIADAVESVSVLETIRELLEQHQVLFIPDQDISPETFERFVSGFGAFDDHGAYPIVEGTQHVQVLESTPEAPSKIELWHSDMTFKPRPPHFTFLHAQIVPEVGGDTLWASVAAAFDALSPHMREFLSGLTAEHDFRHGFKESLAEPGGADRLAALITEFPPVVHPVVRTNPDSGRRALYVNALFTTRVRELTRLESEDLLEFLCRYVTTEEFTVRLPWQPGTMAVWDNRVTLHKPVNDFFPAHRRMHRLTVAGETPI